MYVLGWLSLGSIVLVVGCGGGEKQPSLREGGSGGSFITGAGGASLGTGTQAPTTASAGEGGRDAPQDEDEDPQAICPPSAEGPFQGPKLVAPPHEWMWVDFPGAKCRDGTSTGIGVRRSPTSTKLFIYLEGGGACFNSATCAANLGTFGKGTFDTWKGTVGKMGIFDAGAPDNPVGDWNAIYVPYCTGDVHVGYAPQSDVPGSGTPKHQDFIGYANIGLYLERVVPTFSNATHVLLVGSSAGGFGAAFNYDRIATAFCPAKVTLVDDSGPPMADEFLAPCLQKQWRELWNIAATLPEDCSNCTSAGGGGIVNYVSYLSSKWQKNSFGLVSSTHDAVISAFFGFGHDQCSTTLPLSGDTYQKGLEDLRDHYLSPPGNWGTYYVDSAMHTYLISPLFYSTKVGNRRLVDWMRALLNGKRENVAP